MCGQVRSCSPPLCAPLVLQSPLRGPFQKKADRSGDASKDDTWVASPFILIDVRFTPESGHCGAHHVRFVPIADITSFGDLSAVKTSMTSADFQSEGDRPRIIFLSSLSILPAQIQKKSHKNNSMTPWKSGSGGLQKNQHCSLLATDFPLALALRGADAMWTTLFTVTFVIAVVLQLAALSQVDD